MKGIQLTIEEKQLLVEALLFTCSVDVCSEHTQSHRIKMIELAEKLNKDVGKLYNIYIFNEDVKEENTENILKKFSNIPVENAITS